MLRRIMIKPGDKVTFNTLLACLEPEGNSTADFYHSCYYPDGKCHCSDEVETTLTSTHPIEPEECEHKDRDFWCEECGKELVEDFVMVHRDCQDTPKPEEYDLQKAKDIVAQAMVKIRNTPPDRFSQRMHKAVLSKLDIANTTIKSLRKELE